MSCEIRVYFRTELNNDTRYALKCFSFPFPARNLSCITHAHSGKHETHSGKHWRKSVSFVTLSWPTRHYRDTVRLCRHSELYLSKICQIAQLLQKAKIIHLILSRFDCSKAVIFSKRKVRQCPVLTLDYTVSERKWMT